MLSPRTFSCLNSLKTLQRYETFRKLIAIAPKKLQCLTKSPRQRYGKRHKKALGKARNQRSLAEGKSKSGAEGESLKLLKESGAIFSLRTWYPCGKRPTPLTLAKLTQHLKVNTVIAEFLFHKSVVSLYISGCKGKKIIWNSVRFRFPFYCYVCLPPHPYRPK